MRDAPNRPSFSVILVALCCIPLIWGCTGGNKDDGPGAAEVVALNLDNGDRKLFDSAEAVPDGWALCEDQRCQLPPNFPCQVLGSGACLLSAQCRLKLRCEFDLSGYGIANQQSVPGGDSIGSSDGGGLPDGQPEPPQITGAPAGCEFVCTVNGPQQTCDEIREQQVCEVRPDCNWDWVRLGGLSNDLPKYSEVCGSDNCAPAPVGYCRPSTPPTCLELDERSCYEREDCVWSPDKCPLYCLDSACEMACAPFCQPRVEPPECPAIGHEEPDCPDGQVFPKYDDKGCIVGYECRAICPPAPLGMPYCPDGEVEPIRDERQCVIGYRCRNECPDITPPRLDCTDGRLVPKYDDRGCVVGYECVSDRRCEVLQSDYAQVLREAKSCQAFARTGGGDPNLDSPDFVAQCSLTVPDSLGCPACPTFVNASEGAAVETLKKLRGEFERLGCLHNLVCPMVMCVMPEGASCVPGADGVTGYCADSRRDY